MNYAHTMFSTDPCSAVTGQMAVDLMVNPPRLGDPSYPNYNAVTAYVFLLIHIIGVQKCFTALLTTVACLRKHFLFPHTGDTEYPCNGSP